MRFHLILASLFLIVSCSSSSDPVQQSGEERLLLPNVVQRGSLFFGSSDSAPINLDVNIWNGAGQNVRIRRIAVDTPGMAEYYLQNSSRAFDVELAPRESKAFPVFATAVARVRRPTGMEPLQVRLMIDFDMAGKSRREIFLVQAEAASVR